ncbi:sugar ABC transporter substrate-binding protein [Vallitalea guaymasensis]|uniref:sugar ABC transporter substrate-binding protein n=1 Tax=Vallitalea guaymasensis TaxID=1185412 RepID=UPI002355FF89|nr:sugar ABC transporter substrate-binding protein [Vallitalea guaymasensis]
MKRKISTLIISILLVTFVLAGCSKDDTKNEQKSTTDNKVTEKQDDKTTDKKKEITIGFVPMTLNNEYFITMVNGAKQKAEELGIKLDVQAADQHASAAAQLTIVENMITSGVDGICIVPSSSEGLSTALTKCKEAGIPVINLDTKIDQSILDEAGLKVPFYGTDNYAGAEFAGAYVIENFDKGTETAILTGIEGQQNAADRRNGFFDAAGSHVNVVAEQSANWEVDQGYTATQNILSANPNIGMIFASNDGMAIGALRAVEEAGKKEDIKIIGFDAISEALNLVEKGDMYGTVAQYPAEMGILGVENMVKIINGEDTQEYIDTGAKLITKENVEEHKKYCEQFAD